MIGIRGVTKKPITDATASPNDVREGMIFYNNSGRSIGTFHPLWKDVTPVIATYNFPPVSNHTPFKDGTSIDFDDIFEKFTIDGYTLTQSPYGEIGEKGIIIPRGGYSLDPSLIEENVLAQYNFPSNVSTCIGMDAMISGQTYYCEISLSCSACFNVTRTKNSYTEITDGNTVGVLVSNNSKKIYMFVPSVTSNVVTKKVSVDTDIPFKFHFI